MATARAIGIDLGTTYSCVGIFQNGKVEIIANEHGNRTTPSMVAFNDNERMIGDAAKNQAAKNAKNTIYDAKRLIGRCLNDPKIKEDLKLWPFNVVENEGKLMIQATYKGELKAFLPEAISSMVLENLKTTAESYLGGKVTDAVVTVPVYFNDQQRQATLDAGKIAGLNILRIINEPSAAAFAYGLEKKGDKNILIFDLGGGTLDISILTIKEGTEFTVLASAGDTHLGGEDFDNKLVSFLAEEFQRKHGKDVKCSPKALSRMRTAAERAKRTLSSCTNAEIEMDALLEGIDFSVQISRARFENLCSDLFDSIMEHVAKALADAKMDKTSIDEVVLSGGSTRILKVQTLLKNFFRGKELNQSINGDEAVAYGATIQAAVLSGTVTEAIKDIVMFEVTPLSLGVNIVDKFDFYADRLMSVVIPRNTRIPCKRMTEYHSTKDNQTAVAFEVAEGEQPIFKENCCLGKVVIDGVTPAAKQVAKFDVTFDLDMNSILKVFVNEKGTTNKRHITIVRKNKTAGDIARMVHEAKRFKEDDARNRKIIEARLALENFTIHVSSLASSLHLKVIDKKIRIVKSCEDVFEWLISNSRPEPEECEQKQKELTASLVDMGL